MLLWEWKRHFTTFLCTCIIKMSENMLKLLEVDLNLWFVIMKVSLVIFCSTVNSPNRPKTYYTQTKRNCNAQTSGAWDFWDLIKNKYHIIFSGVCTLPILIFALTYLLWNKNLLWPERGDIISVVSMWRSEHRNSL